MSVDQRPYDSTGSQAERTSLAWSRTLLALSALVAFVSVHAAAIGGLAVLAVIGILAAAALAVSSSVVTRRVWLRSVAALDDRGRIVRPSAVLMLSATAVALAAVSLSTIAWTNLR